MNCSDIMNTYIATIVSAAVEAKQDLFFDHLTSSLGLEEGAVSEAAASFDWGVDPFQSKTAAKGKKKVLPKGDGKVYLVLNYGPKSHALFGDTMAISDTVLNPLNEKCVAEGKKKVIGYNKGLAYGPGWVIIDKERVKEVETALKKAKVVYDSLEKIEYEKLRETKAKAATEGDEPEDDAAVEEEQEQLEVEPIEPKVVKAKQSRRLMRKRRLPNPKQRPKRLRKPNRPRRMRKSLRRRQRLLRQRLPRLRRLQRKRQRLPQKWLRRRMPRLRPHPKQLQRPRVVMHLSRFKRTSGAITRMPRVELSISNSQQASMGEPNRSRSVSKIQMQSIRSKASSLYCPSSSVTLMSVTSKSVEC